MQQALAALEAMNPYPATKADQRASAIAALRARLAEPETCKPGLQVEEPEPVAWRFKPMVGSPWSVSDDGYYISCKKDKGYIVEPLYTTPPTRSPLTPVQEAAPELLGALKAVQAFIEGEPDAVWPTGIIRAAIAKAGGNDE